MESRHVKNRLVDRSLGFQAVAAKCRRLGTSDPGTPNPGPFGRCLVIRPMRSSLRFAEDLSGGHPRTFVGRRARAFTLVETIMVLVLLSTLTVLLWQYLSGGRRREARVDFQLNALQTAMAIRSNLEEDFGNILPKFKAERMHVEGTSIKICRLSHIEGGSMVDYALKKGLVPSYEFASYEFNPAKRTVYRNGVALGLPIVTHALFTYTGGDVEGYTLKVKLDMIPSNKSERDGLPDKISFPFSFHSPQGTLILAHQNWIGDYFFDPAVKIEDLQ